MIFFLVLTLSVAPILKNQEYPAMVKECTGEQLVVQSSGNNYTLSLFNIKITTKEGMEYACKRIAEATSVSFLVDTYAPSVDQMAAWIYVDGALLQKELVLRNDARVLIHNPEYLHTKELEEAVATANAKLPQVSHKAREYDRRRGSMFLLVNFGGLFLTLCITFWLWLRSKRKAKQKQHSMPEDAVSLDEREEASI